VDLIGSIATNPYWFSDFGVQQIVLTVDSDTGPQRHEINVDVENNRVMEAYKSLQHLISNVETDGMSLDEYLQGNLVFGFSILPATLESTSQPIRKGRVDISLKFKTAVAKPLTIIVYSQYDSAYTITPEGEYILVE